MSGIYIPGMEMPTSCFQCEFRTKIDPDNLMCIISQKTFEERFCHIESRDKSCPLVPVPPHGRLIDADALEMERMAENARKSWHDSFAVVFNGDPYYEAAYDCTEQLKELVNNAPTIIPADPADKEGEG